MTKSSRVLLCMLLLCLMGCRGYNSEKEPIHLNPNLDFQAKFKPQTLSEKPVVGTVPWGDRDSFSVDDRDSFVKMSPFNSGKKNGSYLSEIPLSVDSNLLRRGQERFDIYCSACHDKAGSGQGMVVKRGFLPPPDLSDPRIVSLLDGELFDIISNGIRNMPAYSRQIHEEDRWAIVAYVRALQKSQHASLNDVPEQLRFQLNE